MTELELITRILEIQASSQKAALATVIRTKGSTPRKVGAKMIVYSDGTVEGTIGGGCGEGEVIEKALEVIATGRCTQHQVDLTKGLFYEDGGICGGIQDVFIEPLHEVEERENDFRNFAGSRPIFADGESKSAFTVGRHDVAGGAD